MAVARIQDAFAGRLQFLSFRSAMNSRLWHYFPCGYIVQRNKQGSTMRCAMTGPALNEPFDGIWDDGEWISWDWINHQLYDQERQAAFPKADLELIQVFDDLVRTAADYKALTGRYLQIWGELGELYGNQIWYRATRARHPRFRRPPWQRLDRSEDDFARKE
jgi:hypothetical protein